MLGSASIRIGRMCAAARAAIAVMAADHSATAGQARAAQARSA